MWVGRRLKQLAYRNYFTAKLHFQIFSMPRMHGREPLWIYQMGKVGSSTIKRSLNAISHHYATFFVHDLTQAVIDDMEQAYQKSWSASYNPQHLWQSQYIRKQIDQQKWVGRCKVISLVRDPVARNISSFFNNIYLHYNLDTLNVDEALKRFLDDFDHDTPLVWFDRELKTVCGLDVFESAFPKEQGYQIYHEEKVDVLVLRLESLSMCVKEAFKDFLGIDGIQLENANIGKNKNYSSLYRKFLDSVSLPSSYLDVMYNSDFSRHFYTEKEIETFRLKWIK